MNSSEQLQGQSKQAEEPKNSQPAGTQPIRKPQPASPVSRETDQAKPVETPSPPRTAQSRPKASVTHSAALNYATGLSEAFHDAAEGILSSVVTVQKTVKPVAQAEGQEEVPGRSPLDDLFPDPLLRRFFRDIPIPDIPQGPEVGMGSGVIIDPSGIILTNNHVAGGEGKVTIRFTEP